MSYWLMTENSDFVVPKLICTLHPRL